MNRTISLPEDVIRQAEELAKTQDLSLEEFLSSAVAEQFAASEYFRRRGERASVERFRAALEQIPDVEPEPHDRII